MGFFAPNSAANRPAVVSAQMNEVLYRVYTYMAFGLLMTAGVAWVVARTPLAAIFLNPIVMIIAFFAQFGLVMYINMRIDRMSAGKATALFMIYAALMGLTLSVIYLAFSGAELATAMLTTAGMFGGLTLVARSGKVDMSKFSGILTGAVIGLIIASFVNILIGSSVLTLLISLAGVVIFSGLILYDTQWIMQMAYSNTATDNDSVQRLAIIGALHLYINVLNLFIFLLQIFGILGSDD